MLASASLHGLRPCLCSRVALPRLAPRDRVWAPKSDVSVHSPLLRVCVLVLFSEHFSELAVSLLLSFCLSGLRSHAVVTAEHRAVACVHAQALLPSLPFKLSGLKGVRPSLQFGERTRDCALGQAGIIPAPRSSALRPFWASVCLTEKRGWSLSQGKCFLVAKAEVPGSLQS